MQSKLRIFATAFLVFSLSLFVFLFISPREVDAGDKVKIPLCHVTASSTNRYVYIEVAPSAVDGDGKNDHTHHVQYDNENTAYYDLWTGDGRGSVINGPDDCPGGAVVVTETHSLRLTSMCTDLKTEKNIWRVFHKDTSDYFYPVLLGYEIYSGPISTIDKFFTYNHTEATRFTDPYLFRTPVTGESQTVKLYWWNYITDKWVYSDTKESKNEPCEPLYEQCSVTTEEPGEWSAWVIDSEDNSRFVSERIISYFDSQEKEYLCDSTTEKKYLDRDICEWDEELYADDPLCVEPNGNGDTEEEDDDEGDVLGVDDEAEVKGTTTVVLAPTAAGDRSTIFLIQSLLLIATGFSLIYVGKEYLNRV